VLEHLQALDLRDRALRFGYGASNDQIGRYVDRIDLGRDELLGVFNRRLRLVAVAHLAFAEGGATAEFGVSVLKRARRRGFGARLFEYAGMHARNRGVGKLVVYVARNNDPMLGIVRRAGARLSFDGAEATADLPLQSETLGSQIEEVIAHQAAEINYRLKRQVLWLTQLWPDHGGAGGSAPAARDRGMPPPGRRQ
jgi:ribosomal protein S18 acetylase RimI-like enzyme